MKSEESQVPCGLYFEGQWTGLPTSVPRTRSHKQALLAAELHEAMIPVKHLRRLMSQAFTIWDFFFLGPDGVKKYW